DFVTQLIYPAVQANCIYENVYLLGTSLERPVIARGMISVADKEGCKQASPLSSTHLSSAPDIKVIAPWRLPELYNRFPGRQALLAYAAEKGISVHTYEAGILEDPNTTPPDDMRKLTVSLQDAPAGPEQLSIESKAGLPVKVVIS
ncbi:argininosuccinate synthase, partial [Suillus occidentalis]